MPKKITKLGILFLAGFLLATSQVFAAADDFGITGDEEVSSTKNKEESVIIDELCRKMEEGTDEKYKDWGLRREGNKWIAIVENVKKDPFEPRIVKKVIQAAPPPKAQVVKPVEKPKPAAPPIKPIKLTVNGIVGNEGSRLAIIKFENDEMTITKDQIVEGKFKVVDIYADRVVVYSNKEQRRHTFKIGGEDSKE